MNVMMITLLMTLHSTQTTTQKQTARLKNMHYFFPDITTDLMTFKICLMLGLIFSNSITKP